ncbi:MAG: response regulator, partial [Deltaproteobacteria bacterium]|nr:response regulator [Deltaproteobacteria bacterium]
DLAGLSLEAFRNSTVAQLSTMMPAEDRDRFLQAFGERMAGREPSGSNHYRHHHVDGSVRWIEAYSTTFDVAGQPAIGAAILDITDRKTAETELRESEEKYRVLVESLPQGVVILQDEELVFASPGLWKMLQAEVEHDQVERGIQAFVGAATQEHVLELRRQRLQGLPLLSTQFAADLRRADGTEFPVEISYLPVQWRGRPAVQVVITDVTERIQLQEQRGQAEKMQAIGTLAGGIAHDFNNLLTGVLGNASMIKLLRPVRDDVYQCAEIIERAAQKAAELTQQLLGFARTARPVAVPVEVQPIVSDVVALLAHAMGPEIEVVQEAPVAPVLALANPGQIQQVIMNLAVNARDAMPEGGRLTFHLEAKDLRESVFADQPDLADGPYVILSVGDTGTGIDNGAKERIFEPFYTTKETGKGTGMGLAVAYGIVRNHGGAILVETEMGVGSTFRVALPAATGSGAPESVAGAGAIVRGAGRILVVDDEEVVRDTVGQMLTSLGYEVVMAKDGQAALEIYAKRAVPFDLVLLDVSMPVMGGRDCFEALRALDPEVRAVLSTGHVLTEDALSALLEGMQGFVHKPYILEDLSRAISEAMGH